MIQPTIGFIIYGVHKDGLLDPMGKPFIDEAIVAAAKQQLIAAGLQLVEYPVVVATKEEAKAALRQMKHDEKVDAVILFSGTWVWAANMVAAVREYAATGKGVLIWTHPGSQGWRPVGGLVLHGGLLEIGVPHKFVYGETEAKETIRKHRQFCAGCALEEHPEFVHDGYIWRSRYGSDLWRSGSVAMDANVWSRH